MSEQIDPRVAAAAAWEAALEEWREAQEALATAEEAQLAAVQTLTMADLAREQAEERVDHAERATLLLLTLASKDEHLLSSSKECRVSPAVVCMFDKDRDPDQEECIFCAEAIDE